MNPRLRQYLNKLPPAEVDPTFLRDLEDCMEKAAEQIPDIIREREQLAAEIRLRPMVLR